MVFKREYFLTEGIFKKAFFKYFFKKTIFNNKHYFLTEGIFRKRSSIPENIFNRRYFF